ncbi:MAG TPA: hypothetical protein VG937_15580 [Polyangiaceae bacterium]|nr:hypothetical protein [Polyangiaceae bacterium]
MFGSFGRRALESVVGLFALLGFAFVPLGSKTGLEHTLAVLATPSVREAASGLMIALDKAKAKLVEAFVPSARDRLPLPIPENQRATGRAVRPEVPSLPGNARNARAGLPRAQ